MKQETKETLYTFCANVGKMALIVLSAYLLFCLYDCTKTRKKKEPVSATELWKEMYLNESKKIAVFQKEKAFAYHLADSLILANSKLKTLTSMLPVRKKQPNIPSTPFVQIDTSRYDSLRNLAIAKESIILKQAEIIEKQKGLDSLMSASLAKKDSKYDSIVTELEKPDPKPKKKRFSVNVSGGYGYSIGVHYPTPQIGVTVGLKLFSF